MAVTIKKVSTNEPNVSKREVTYDLYVDGQFKAHYKDLVEAMDAKAALERANSTTYSNGRQKAEIRQIAGGYAVYVDGKEVYDSVSKINCENYIKRNNLGPAVVANSAPYSNGRMKAETYLNQKMAEAGVKVENINNQFAIRETSRGFDVLYKGRVVYQSYNREEAESWARSNKSTPMDYDESSAPK